MISKPHLRLLGVLKNLRLRGVLKKQHSRVLGVLRQQRKELFASLPAALLQVLMVALGFIFFTFLEPGFSIAFVGSLSLLTFAFISFGYRRYIIATSAVASLFVFVAIMSATASYFIASDQSRLRYRIVDGISYVEFPAKPSLLKAVSYLFGDQSLVIVDSCGRTKVAKLPLLPLAPLYADNDLVHSPIGYRRIPPLRFEKVELNVHTSSGPNPDPTVDAKTFVSMSFGFADATQAVPATEVFPRSVTCMAERSVPLLPVMEFLPWNPEETDALVRAVVKVQYLRSVYLKRALSLDDLNKIRMSNKDETYRPLLDFVAYSILTEMLDGNILSEARADIINQQCVLAGNPVAFADPFSTLAERRLRQIVNHFGPEYHQAHPACHVPDDIVDEVERERSNKPGWPMLETFRRCIELTIPMSECLADDDSPTGGKLCSGDVCPVAPRKHNPPWETLFQTYDLEFSEVVATRSNKLVEVRTIDPSECPQLRDREEESHFVARWRWDSYRILREPYKCTSPEWRRKLIESQRNFENALLCQKSKGIAVESLMTAEQVKNAFEDLPLMRCDVKSYADNFSIPAGALNFIDELDANIAKLKTYSAVVGGQRIQQVVDALELAMRVKAAVCGGRSINVCIEEYSNSGGLQQLEKALEALNWPPFVKEKLVPVDLFNSMARMNNMILNMALCDLLKDDNIQSLVGHNRDEFCDGRGLKRYRLIQPKDSVRTVRRPADDLGEGMTYIYEESLGRRDFWLKMPITK